MEVEIRNLTIETCDAITEAVGDWARDKRMYYVDEIEVYDVDVNIESITLECALDGIWLKKGDLIFKLEREDYLEIVIY